MIIALAVAMGALAQAVSGIGFGLVCGPIFVAVLGPVEGVRLAVFVSAFVNAAVLAREHRDVHLGRAMSLLIPAAIATPGVAYLVHLAPTRVAKVIAGIVCVLGATALLAGLRWHAARGRRGAALAGVISAAMNASAGIGGPAVVVYTDNAGWPHQQVRSTLQVYFLGLNLIALLTLGLPRLPVHRVISVAGAMVAGLSVGHVIAGRVSTETARRLTLLLSVSGGLAVLVTAFTT